MDKLIIAYCIENQYVAAKIATVLKGKIEIEKIVFDTNHGIEGLKKATNGNIDHVLLLISDNFLKSEKCMNEALPFLQSLGAAQRLIPVTTEGIYPNATSGQMSSVPTSFDRVSNVIQYMNFWQDRYLELRKLKGEGDEVAHNEKVRVVRTISSEIGELLRYFRTMAFYSYDQFNESNFIILYRVLGLEVTKEMEEAKKIAISHTVLPTAIVASKEHSESMYANGIKLPIAPIEEEKPPVDLSEIPGIAQLTERFNVQDASIGGIADAIVVQKEVEIPQIETETKVIANNIISEIHKEDIKSVEVDTLSPLEAMVEGFRTKEKKSVEQISKDEIMEKQTHIETVENTSSQPIETPVVAVESPIVEEVLDKDEDDLVKKIASEVSLDTPTDTPSAVETDEKEAEKVEEKVEEAEITEIIEIEEKTEAELPEEIIDEEAIQQEVARVFDEAEQVDETFDFESEIAHDIENQKLINRDAPAVSEKIDLAKMQSALVSDPFNNVLRYNYATELTNRDKFVEATEQVDILLDNDRTNVDAYVLLAYLAEQQGDFILSLNSLEKVTLLKPDYPGIYYKLGRLTNEHFKKHNRKALRYFKEAIEQDPTNADVQYRYGLAIIEQNGDYKTAIDHLSIAVENAPQHDAASFELAKAYFETNDRINASKWYARAIELNTHFKTESNDELFHYEEPKPEPIPEPEPEIIDNGLTVLITGATSGIGKATATIFAKNGYRVILTGRRADRLEAMKTEFEDAYHNRIQLLNFDVRSLDDVKKALSDLDEDFKNVDILINNAGLASGLSPIHEGDIEDWDKMIDTNIKGLLYMTRAIAPSMVARRKGHIVNIGSIAGKEIYPNGNVYSASKFAVDALTRAMRVDLHKYNIRVSQVAPGAVEETEFALVRFHGDAEKASIYNDFTPLKASDVAETIYFMVTRPEYVNIQDVVMMGTQQGSANHFDRSGRTDIVKEAIIEDVKEEN